MTEHRKACIDCEHFVPYTALGHDGDCSNRAVRVFDPIVGMVTVDARDARLDDDKCGIGARLFEAIRGVPHLPRDWPATAFVCYLWFALGACLSAVCLFAWISW